MGLESGADLWSDRHVTPAADDVTSLTAIGGNTITARCVYYYALERGAGGARSIACGTRGTRKTLPHVLATDLWFRAATGRRAGRDEGSHSRFFCAAAGTPGSECGAQGKRTPAFLSAHIAETFPDERA